MGDFRKRVGLVHELGELGSSEEGVDDRREGLGRYQVGWNELLAVAYVHLLAYGPCHTGEAYAELVCELLAYGPDTPVAQVVDIVHLGLFVDKANEVAYDFYDIRLGKHPHIVVDGKGELLVQTVPADLAEVVSLLGEEKLFDDVPGSSLIRRLRVAELLVDVVDCLHLGVGGILLKGVEYDLIFLGFGFLLLDENLLDVGLEKLGYGLLVENLASFHDGLGSLDRNHLTGILVHEVLYPGLDDLGGKLAALILPEGLLIH